MDEPRSLSHEEAQRRAGLLGVTAYDIEVDLTGLRDGDTLRAVSTIRFTSIGSDDKTFVDCVATVTRAELNGTPIPTETADGRLAVTGLTAENVLVVESIQRETASRAGVHRAVDPADGEAYVWMSFEPDEARRVWACFDQPDLKAPHRFTVLAPQAWTVTSNSAPETVEDAGGGSRRWTFAPTPPLSTYVPVVNAGPFHELRREIGGHDLGLLCRRSLAPFLDRDADELFDLTAAGLAFFGEQFAMPFPQARYDQVFVPELGGAMENYGCVTWSDWFVFRHEPSYGEREIRAVVLLHEMAHMWFGDIVTMRWWDDLWLNEAFADWAANWAAAAATEYTDAWATFLAGRKLSGYAADRGPTSHPIRQSAPDVGTAAAGFDMITYAKGASVLRQLVAYVGEDAFVAGLRGYFAKHAWGNATLSDLIAELSSASGRDLDAWVAGWLDTAGTDTLTVTHDGDQPCLVATGPGDVPARPHRVAVGTYGPAADGGLVRRDLAALDVAGNPVPLTLTAQADDVLLVNDEDLTFATVVPDDATLELLLRRAAALPTPLARAVAVTTAWGLLTSLRLPTTRFVQCATAVLRAETAESVVEPMLDLAVQAARLWSGERERDDAMAAVAETCVALADGGIAAVRRPALRALAATASSDEHLAIVEQATAADVDLRWRLLSRLAVLDRFDAAAVAAADAADSDPDSWVKVLAVRAAVPDGALKAEAWQAVVDQRLPLSAFGALGRAFWQPGQDDVVAPYAERYLAMLPTLGRHGMIDAMAVTGAMFPVVGVGTEFLDRATAAVASDEVNAVVRRSVLARADDVRRMIAARG